MPTLDDIFEKVSATHADLQVLKTQMKFIVGNGKPGRLDDIEDVQEDQSKDISFAKGAIWVIGALVTIALTTLAAHLTFGAH